MSSGRVSLFLCTCLLLGTSALAQVASAPTATVPRLIRVQGTLRDAAGKPLTGTLGALFAIYKDEDDPEALWQETQTLDLDSAGRYSALLGVTSEQGLPLEIFSAGSARWLGVRPDGQAEQPRILLLSVAYALKAADTEMLGGRPASAYALANSARPATANSTNGSQIPTVNLAAGPLLVQPAAACSSVTSGGTATANQVAKFTSACNVEISAIFESGGNVGIGNTSPAGTLDVAGTGFFRGLLTAQAGLAVGPGGTATTSQGFNSSPNYIEASVYNTTLNRAVNYLFDWQAEPSGNNSTNTNATLNLLYGAVGSLLETGLSINRNGIITFASGQTFPSSGGTVTSVATGAGLTGGPITTSGTISIPPAGVSNSMLANNSITVTAGTGLSGGGSVPLGGSVTLNSTSSGGTVTSVATGAGLTGGPVTTSGTISIPSAGVTNAMLANNSITVNAGSGLSGGGTVALGGSVTLTNTSSGGTVTSVNTGAGLTGGPVTTTGTISIPAGGVLNTMLANPFVTVVAGSGLSGGGTVALGGTVTLASNLSGTANGVAYFSNPSTLTSTAAPANGQLLIGSSSNAPALATLTAGSNISITNGPGSITISSTGGGGGSPTLSFFVTGNQRSGGTQPFIKNLNKLWGFLLPYNVTTTQVTYDITTADATSNNYDIGIFNSAGNLVVDIGPTPGSTFSATKGFHTVTWDQGSTTLPAGKYYIGFTTNCNSACAVVAAVGSFVSFAANASAGATTGGALSSTITPPADTWASGTQPTLVIR